MQNSFRQIQVDGDQVAANGFAIIPQFIDATTCDHLREESVRLLAGGELRRGGLRGVLRISEIFRELVRADATRQVMESLLGAGCRVVRSILFDKTPASNWLVPWHQDTTIAVCTRQEVAEFGPWSVKDGVSHVRPPSRVLEKMLTLRIHIDDSGIGNGPMLVVPSSHARGVVAENSIDSKMCDKQAVECSTPVGGAVLMRPLTLHASRRAVNPEHRRVLHLEFAAKDALPAPLEWAEF